MADTWFYLVDGEQTGPVNAAYLRQLSSVGKLQRESLVWKEGLAEWIPARRLKGLFPDEPRVTPVPPPPPRAAYTVSTASPSATQDSLRDLNISNTLVWVLAFAPLIGGVLEIIVANALDQKSGGSLWFITLGLNIALSVWDAKLIQRVGHTDAKFNSWLVPVYLFQRAQFFKQAPTYPIVWIVCFLVSLVAFAH